MKTPPHVSVPSDVAGEHSADGKKDDLKSAESTTGSDDGFDDLLRAAVSPLDTLEPVIEPGQFVRLPAGAKVSERFVVEWCVAAGGMGDVYRCQDLETHRPAALKVIRQVDDHSRFRREASILSAMAHDAIVRYLGHGTTDAGAPYLAMEWLEGEDLSKTLARSSLSVADTLTLVRRVCDGLSVAHRHGFVHRDIKPSNLFVCHGRLAETKVLDFGVAHRGVTTQTSTRAGTMLGTVGYMAPEQAWGMPAPDPRDDLFSLGCVMFECLTGRPAFAGENAIAVLEAVLQVEPPDVRQFAPDIPAELAALVRQLLKKDRRERPASCDELLRKLDALESDSPARGDAARPHFAVCVKVRGADLESAATLLRSIAEPGAVTVSSASEQLLVAVTTSHEVTLVDAVEAAVDAALKLHHGCPDLSIVVTAPMNAADVALGDEARDAASRMGELVVDATTLRLYRSRHALTQRGSGHATDAALHEAELVGRDAERSVLEAVFAECCEDEAASATLITGPPGSGKSRLLAEFLANIGRSGVGLLMTRAQRATSTAPLRALQALLQNAGASPEDDVEPRDVAAVFSSYIARESRRGPLVVCVDDAQWIDLASLQVLTAMVGAEVERPILLVGAARPQISTEHNALWQTANTRVVTLRPLSPRAAERFVRSLGSAAEKLQWLVNLAEGYPRLFVSAAAEAGAAEETSVSATAALLAELLCELPPNERAVVAVACDFDSPFSPTELGQAVASQSDLARDLTALCARGILVHRPSAEPSSEIHFTFAHPILRRAAAELRLRPPAPH